MPPIINPSFQVLIVDDELDALQGLELILRGLGLHQILACQDSRRVIDLLKKESVSLILLDLTMPFRSGEDLLAEIVQDFPEIPVAVITGTNEIDTAVRCMQAGAMDYLVKPVEISRLKANLARYHEYWQLRQENLEMKHQLLDPTGIREEFFREILTRNRTMRAIFKYVQAVARSREPIFITGETGVGKELLAQSIHKASQRPGSFVPVNAAGLDDNTFSDTLFGHRKGAFTDAFQSRSGLVERARGGTLFLDEIGDLSLPSQIKLLRLLQENEYYPLGSDVPQKAEARIVASTNIPAGRLEKSGTFRKDLFYRLYIHHIHIPPLRERMDDVPLLAGHFIEETLRSQGKKKSILPGGLLPLLMSYSYPGNIRELRALIVDAVSAGDFGASSLRKLRERMSGEAGERQTVRTGEAEDWLLALSTGASFPTIQEAETALIRLAMKQADGNQSVACQLLGIARQTLNKKLKRLNRPERG